MRHPHTPFAIRSCRAFSLVELMVVIVIIGMFATIVAIEVLDLPEDAKVSKAMQEVEQIGKAIQTYRFRAEHRSLGSQLPETLEQLQTGPDDHNGTWTPLLDRNRFTDPWGNRYLYRTDPTNPRGFDLRSLGGDGRPGGEMPWNADIIYGEDRTGEPAK